MTTKEKAEAYYWAHNELHEASSEQEWLKDLVVACFQDGYISGKMVAYEAFVKAIRDLEGE